MKRNASSGTTSPMGSSRQSTLNVTMPRKRQSLIGAASSHGRLFKVLGDLFTLAGRTEDASVWCVWLSGPTCMQHLIDNARYTEALALFKASADPLWHASTLEGLATLSLLDAWSGQGFVRAIVYCIAIPTNGAHRAYSKPPLAQPKSPGVTLLTSLIKRSHFMPDLGRCPSSISVTTSLPIFIQWRSFDMALFCSQLGLPKVGVRSLLLL